MVAASRCLIIAALGAAGSDATGVSMTMTRGNPIRKVVTMIQNIQKKVESEGKAAEDLFEKFMCECGKQQTELTDAIAAAESKGSDVAAAAEAGGKQAKQLQADITQAKKDRASAKDAISSATEIREKEAGAFKDMAAEASSNIDAMGKAISAVESAGSAAFLQTSGAKQLRDIVQTSQSFVQEDREEVLAFLSGEQSSEGSGEIVGMLKQQQETMSSDLKEAEATEADAKNTFGDLVKAKNQEFNTLQASIEEKMARLGELGVANAEAANDGGDTAAQLEEDKKALADSKAACADRQAAYDKEKKIRAEEILALADTIKLLNSDEALELFKKSLPGASSFMQVAESASSVKARALAVIQEAAKHQKKGSVKLDFVSLALRGRKVGFEKVIALIDKFIGNLKSEQTGDDQKVAYCNKQFDKADDEKKALERKVSDAETAIKDAKESVATLTEEIKATKEAIVTLDNDVVIATAQRQQENGEYKTLMTQNTAAMSLIKMAIERMNKFYNPSLLQTQGGNAVISMMTTLVTDLEKENAVAKTEEENSQEDYEKFMADTKEQRIADAKTLEDKEAAKGEADQSVQDSVDAKTGAGKELQGVLDFIMSLRADCDFVIKYYDTRKQARSDEMDALGKAKDVLQGADYSLLQVSQTKRNLRVRQL